MSFRDTWIANRTKPMNKQTYISYKFGFTYNKKLYGFKNKNLFDLSGKVPVYVKKYETKQGRLSGWFIDRNYLTIEQAKKLTGAIDKEFNITEMDWSVQEDLLKGNDPNLQFMI